MEFRSVGFLGEGKTGVPGEKPLGARTRTNNKLELRSFRPKGVSPEGVSPELKVGSPGIKGDSPELKVVSPGLKVGSPGIKGDSPELKVVSPGFYFDMYQSIFLEHRVLNRHLGLGKQGRACKSNQDGG